MIYEIRTYDVLPGQVPEFEKRFAAALPVRQKFSPLGGFWHTEIGPLNQVIHLWPYETMNERARLRAEAQNAPGWPPNTRELVTAQTSWICHAPPFVQPIQPARLGNVYEMRIYTYKPGAIPQVIESWSRAIEARTQLSPLAGAFYTETGALNVWIHMWAYEDLNHRARIRAEAQQKGIWPPRPGLPPGLLLKQENKILIPAEFSPLH